MDSIAYILLGMIMICLFQASRIFNAYSALDGWVHTVAQPIEINSETLGKGYRNGKMPAFQMSSLNVKYEYWADQNKYVGQTRLKLGHSQRIVQSFDIYYDPNNPEVSIQGKQKPWGIIIMWFVGAIASASVLYGWFVLKSRYERP